MKYLIPIMVCFFSVYIVNGQEVLENNPPSVKWYRVNTPHFKVLYPKGYEVQAQRVANTLEHIREPEAKTMGVKPRRFSVILQNQSSISNGFVSIVPKRSEFYTMPPQDYNFSGTNDWLDQLATHEYRHMVQFQHANRGFNRILYYLFGPATLSAMAITAAPQWYWEGDAVATETAFTHSGRGRIPNFGLLFRTNLQEGRVFNYHKQYLRSYKHNISDHYVLGYHMIGYLRKRTGDPEVWEKISQRAFSVPFIPFTFSNAIKKESGLYVTQLYREMVLDLQKSYEEEQRNLSITPFENVIARNSKAYTDYRFPQEVGDGGVLIMKSGIGDIAQFVVLKDGKEVKAFTPGIVNDAGMLSVAGTRVVWSEYGFDPRWRVKNYSLIKAYDLATKRYWTVSKKSRYSGAALSPDGTKIVTIESNTNYDVTMVVIDTAFGHEHKRFKNPTNAFYSMARWSTDGKEIVVLKTEDNNRSVVSVSYESGEETLLIPPSKENIGHPVLHGNYLFFNSPVSGIDNIYVVDLQQQRKLQVTSSKYGAYNPSITKDGKSIYYNEQTRDGLDVVKISIDRTSWKEFSEKQEPEGYSQYLSEQEGRPTLFDSIPQQQFATQKYSKLSGLVNPYSWGAYFNSSFTQADIGISSQDILSTTAIKTGYLFDINERTGAWRFGVSYQGWYPIIDVDVRFANRSVNEGNLSFLAIDTVQVAPVELDSSAFLQEVKFEWSETTIETGMRIPLITTNSKYHGNFSFGNYVGITKVTGFKNSITSDRFIPYVYRDGPSSTLQPSFDGDPFYFFRDYISNGTLIYNRFNISTYRLLKQNRRDINSKWGQTANINWYFTPYGGDFSGNQFSFYTQLYFPGLFKHHSIWGYWAFQSTDIPVITPDGGGLNNYVFNNQIPLPRGLSVSRFQKFYSMSANYTLPLWYADIAIGPLLNIQRFRGNVFYDYGFGKSTFQTEITQTYASIGGELRMDINVFRFLPQFNVGIRYSYGLKPQVTEVEFLIGLVNF